MSFYNTLKKDINIILKHDLLKKNYKKEIYDMFQVSDPPKDKFGDVSTNAALSLSKFLKTNPENFADILIKELKKIDYIEDIKVEGHGFINLLLKKDFWINELKQVLLKEDKYAFDRKFGDPLPTFKDVMETHQNKPKEQIIESIDLQSHFIELRVM